MALVALSLDDLHVQLDKATHALADLQLAVGAKKREILRLHAAIKKKESQPKVFVKLEVDSSDEQMQPASDSSLSGSGSESSKTSGAASASASVPVVGNIPRALPAVVLAAPPAFLPLVNGKIPQTPKGWCPRCWYAQYRSSARGPGHKRDKKRFLEKYAQYHPQLE